MTRAFWARALFVAVLLALCFEGDPPPRVQFADTYDPYRNEDALRAPRDWSMIGDCGLAGCYSTVSFLAHLPEPLTTLVDRTSFHVCHRDECWDGTLLRANGSTRGRCSIPSSFAIQMRCRVEEEGTGSKLMLGVVEGDPFVDGDRVSLRVSVDGVTRIDHARQVTYGEVTPNGRACGPICRVASVELWPGAPSGVSCGPRGTCSPAVRFDSALPIRREGAGRTRIIACRNDACDSTTDGTVLYDWDDVTNEPIPRSNGGVGFASVGGARVSIREWSQPKRARYRVDIEFIGDSRTYQPGDRYSVEWQSLDGTVLVHEERVVDRYDEWSPGGPGCSAEPCRAKDFRK